MSHTRGKGADWPAVFVLWQETSRGRRNDAQLTIRGMAVKERARKIGVKGTFPPVEYRNFVFIIKLELSICEKRFF